MGSGSKMVSRVVRIVVALLMVKFSSAFLITKAEPGRVVVAPGDKVTLFCAVDDDYEWCKWYNPAGDFCDFEWKRSDGNITMQECGMFEKLSFHGAYDDKECGTTFTAQVGDTGTWKCEIEEYVTWRSRGAGRVQTAEMSVTVQASTTEAAPGTTLPTIETSAGTTSRITKPAAEVPSSTEEITTQSIIPTEDISEENISDAPEAVPQVNEIENAKAGSSSSALVGIFIVIIVIVVAVSGGVYYRKRRNSSIATAVYEREAKTSHDETNMVRDSTSNITFGSGNAENRNLHEYFPPNLTYSTSTPESQART